jgi:hypothetical protein
MRASQLALDGSDSASRWIPVALAKHGRAPWWLLVALAGCGSSTKGGEDAWGTPPPDLIAVRTIDGPWQVVPLPPCGTPIDVPKDKPYELVVVGARPHVFLLRAGPGERVRWPLVNDPPYSPLMCDEPEHLVDVGLRGVPGVSNTAVSVYTKPAGFAGEVYADYPAISTPLGVHDVVAIPYDYTGGLGVYVVKRAVEITSSGFTLDFTTESAAVEHRAVILDGAFDRNEASVVLETSGGTLARVWPEHSSPPINATEISVIPEAGLVAGDQLTYRAWLSSKASSGGHAAWFTQDLRALPTGPITITAPLPVDSASCTLPGDNVILSATTSATFNEFMIEIVQPWDYGGSPELRFVKTAGWPDNSFELPDVAAIPGWLPTWMPRFMVDNLHPTQCGFNLCDHRDGRSTCDRSSVDATP